MIRITYKICLIILVLSCKNDPVTFTSDPVSFSLPKDMERVENKQISEASGIVAGQRNSNILWTLNDSGDTNRIFAIDSAGKGSLVFFVQDAINRDWEAISATTFKDSPFIYIGDIGDNDQAHAEYFIYRVPEPEISEDLPQSNVIKNAQKITFKYPDGSDDAECMMIDHKTKDLYILTKRESKKRLYRLPFPQMYSQTITAEFIAEMSFSKGTGIASYITDGNIAADNSEIIIKSYLQVFYWRIRNNESIPQALARPTTLLPYQPEPQGEAVCFTNNPSGFITLSEESSQQIPVYLYLYRRN